jgi:hypothetical protein
MINARRARAIALTLLASTVAGCGGTNATTSLPGAGAAGGVRQPSAIRISARPETVVLRVRPKLLFLSEPGDQEDIYVTYTGTGVLTAVSSRPRLMPVRKTHDVPRPKRFIVTQRCYCAATITVRDNLGNSASMHVQGT